ncbi:MAG TPA: hypothetical protein V6D37_05805 [Candidatus Sericytochromatia bacterium]|jgi:hypothetical protein
MARPSLSTSRKTTAKAVAEKIAGKKTAKSTTTVADKIPVASSPIVSNSNNTGFSTVVPGLVGITPDAVAGMMPQFQETSYAISDLLNPPETLPQVTEAQFDKGMGIYEGTQRALKLTGAAFDTTRERFTVVGKQAKAFGAGIKAATEFEKVKGDYLDYQGQLETNEQKGVSLGVSQHKTLTDRTAASFDTTTMDEKLKQSELAAELARANTRDKQNKLDEFCKSLGEYAA